MQPTLTLVGAGPGDPELITLKGIRALQQAGVILYDDLVSTELLAYAPDYVPRQYVGKRAGRASLTQADINELIVAMAHAFGHVVRLKGGDSYVLGRGFEEYEYARRHGLACHVVPGVSSSIAVAASAQIPVTCRGVSDSFWVITGTTQSGELSADMPLAVQSDATVVVLMGLHQLGAICDLYRRYGRDHLPMAVIQNGTRPDARSVVGTVADMPARVAAEGVGAPAVIVVGNVVGLHPDAVGAVARPGVAA